MKGVAVSAGSAPHPALVVSAFFALNSCLNVMNRWALGISGFRFPLILTCFHAAFGFLFVLPVVLVTGRWAQYMLTARRQWKGILLVGCCLASNIALNNLSLVYISLSLNQIIRASIPVVTALLGATLSRRFPCKKETATLLVLSSGVSLAMVEAAIHGDSVGVGICMCGVLSGASMLHASSRVLSEKLDVLQLAFLTSPITCGTLLPFVAVRELAPFQTYVGHQGGGAIKAVGIILVGSVVAALYNVVHYAMVLTTSPVTTCVFGQVKIVGLLLLSAAFLGETREFSVRMSLGCALALGGFGMYSWVKVQEGRKGGGNPPAIRPSPTKSRSGLDLVGEVGRQEAVVKGTGVGVGGEAGAVTSALVRARGPRAGEGGSGSSLGVASTT